MQHTETAREIARDTGADWDAYATARGWSGVGIGPVGMSRDSDPLERANYRAAARMLAAGRVDSAEFGHWAVGWIREQTFDAGHSPTVEAVNAILAQLDTYAVLDEDEYAREQWDEDHPANSTECYAEDEDCPCGRRGWRQRARMLIGARGRLQGALIQSAGYHGQLWHALTGRTAPERGQTSAGL